MGLMAIGVNAMIAASNCAAMLAGAVIVNEGGWRDGLAYLTQQGVTTSFDEDQDPLKEYDPAIDENTKSREQRKLTSLWRTRLENQSRLRATKYGCRRLILHAFNEVVYTTLKSEDTSYELVSPSISPTTSRTVSAG